MRISTTARPGFDFARTSRVVTPLFLVFAFGFIRFGIDTALQYQAAMPLFYFGKLFAADYQHAPGGFLDYWALYLDQYLSYPWVGALMAVGMLALVLGLTRCLLALSRRQLFGNNPQSSAKEILLALLTPMPAYLLFLLMARFDVRWMSIGLGVGAALAAAVGIRLLQMLPAWVVWIAFPCAAAAMNVFFGILPAGLFVILAALSQWFARQNVSQVIGFPIIGALVSGISWTFYHLAPAAVMAGFGTGRFRVVAMALCASIPLSILLCSLTATKSQAAPSESSRPPAGTPLALRWALLVLVAGFVLFTVDADYKARVRIDLAASRGRWDNVLNAAPQVIRPDWTTRLNVTRALYHQGRLLDCLFDFWQRFDMGLFPNQKLSMKSTSALSATLLELGQANLAEHFAHEGLEQLGDRPDLLKLLVKINLVKNKPKAARVFLELLRKNPVNNAWASDWLRRIDQDPTLAGDNEISRLKALNVTTDYPSPFEPTGILLQQALRCNPNNRMALEYLVAHCLLCRKPEIILDNIDLLGDRQLLPRSVEEGILKLRLDLKKPLDLHGHTIREGSIDRLARFCDVYSSFQGREEAGRAAMAREFGHTYWYYCCFDMTP